MIKGLFLFLCILTIFPSIVFGAEQTEEQKMTNKISRIRKNRFAVHAGWWYYKNDDYKDFRGVSYDIFEYERALSSYVGISFNVGATNNSESQTVYAYSGYGNGFSVRKLNYDLKLQWTQINIKYYPMKDFFIGAGVGLYDSIAEVSDVSEIDSGVGGQILIGYEWRIDKLFGISLEDKYSLVSLDPEKAGEVSGNNLYLGFNWHY